MTEKRVRIPLSKVHVPSFECELSPATPSRDRTRFRTVDDVVFEVFDASVTPSTLMTRFIRSAKNRNSSSSPSPSSAADQPYRLPNVSSDVFETVLKYTYFHTSIYCEGLLPSEVKEWDVEFMNLDPRQLCELASAAYYLDVKGLVDLTCRAIAAIISGKTADQIRKTFHIEHDFAGTVDRLLPKISRRRGREGSPKKNKKTLEKNDYLVEFEDSGQTSGSQKTVEELSEWINSTTSKKKKKKKRHKDKALNRKLDTDCLDGQSGPCSHSPDSLSNSHQSSDHVHNRPQTPESVSLAKPSANGYAHCSESVKDRYSSSSESDVVISSQKHIAEKHEESSSHKYQKKMPPVCPQVEQKSKLTVTHEHSSDSDSVQFVSSSPAKLKGAINRSCKAVKKSELGRTLEGTEGLGVKNGCTQGRRLLSNTESHRREGRLKEVGSGKSSTKDAPFVPLFDMANGEAPYIDCPEDMDREVEAFQKRLTIGDSLSNHISGQGDCVNSSEGEEKEDEDNESCYQSQDCSSGCLPRAAIKGRNAVNEDSKSVREMCGRDGEEILADRRRCIRQGHWELPESVKKEVLKLEEKKKAVSVRANEIDEQVARLSAERERVRDTLALINMDLTQIRLQYKLRNSDL